MKDQILNQSESNSTPQENVKNAEREISNVTAQNYQLIGLTLLIVRMNHHYSEAEKLKKQIAKTIKSEIGRL